MSQYAGVPERGSVRLERLLPGPIERVWAYLTESALRATWLAGGSIELEPGGAVDLRYDHALVSDEPIPERFRAAMAEHRETGRVTACEPPRLLAFTWGEGPGASHVTFELFPAGPDTRLVLTHRRLSGTDEAIDAASGWHAHVDVLEDRLHGGAVRPFWAAHDRLQLEYRRHLPALLASGQGSGPP